MAMPRHGQHRGAWGEGAASQKHCSSPKSLQLGTATSSQFPNGRPSSSGLQAGIDTLRPPPERRSRAASNSFCEGGDITVAVLGGLGTVMGPGPRPAWTALTGRNLQAADQSPTGGVSRSGAASLPRSASSVDTLDGRGAAAAGCSQKASGKALPFMVPGMRSGQSSAAPSARSLSEGQLSIARRAPSRPSSQGSMTRRPSSQGGCSKHGIRPRSSMSERSVFSQAAQQVVDQHSASPKT